MTKLMVMAGAAVFLLGSSAFASSELYTQGQLSVQKAECIQGSDTVSPSGPCHPNNGFGNGGNDGIPGNSGGKPGSIKCNPNGDTKC
jgi:hypothetical protein